MAEGFSRGHKATSASDILIHVNSFPWKPKSHCAKMEMNSGSGVSEVLHLASLLPPSPGPQGQVSLAVNQLQSISVSSPQDLAVRKMLLARQNSSDSLPRCYRF